MRLDRVLGDAWTCGNVETLRFNGNSEQVRRVVRESFTLVSILIENRFAFQRKRETQMNVDE